MCQFIEEMRSFPPVGARRWLPVPLPAGDAESPPDIADAIDAAIVSRLAADLLASESAETGILEKLGDYWGKLEPGNAKAKAREFLDRGGSVLGFSLGASREGPPKSIARAAARRPVWQSWQIVLLIDEAQDIKPGEVNAGFGTLSALHQGLARAPVSFCAFGLPGTLLTLSDAGVSRLADGRSIRLGGIGETAARQMIDRCFTSFGVVGGAPWREEILDRAANWPQHLTVYLNAAIRQVREASPERMDAGSADLEEAMRDGDCARANYYRQRIARLTRGNIEFGNLARELAPLFGERESRLSAAELTRAIRALSPELSDADITRFVQEAEHSGFLLLADDEYAYSIPIPSFAGHLIGSG